MPAKPITSITLVQAQAIVGAALEYARGNAFPPMTIAVLDAAGKLVAFAREDGSSLLREPIARGKAHGALNMGVGSRSLAAMAAARPAFVNSLIALADGNLVPGPGGVLVHDEDDRLVGAVGVSGHLPDDDEVCAIHGITAAGLRADPGA
ncbi:GlcG/HbpS family heme-binding protein [Nocardia jiangxiensis]|uniref:Heme-binding protein n=1 Tax=Nocardia jiangxiensis TaxID=282685 RepID=A0ABW6SG86_9NOCA|nr:heme-binding protein [Nocardia jiangxiensis]